MATLVTYINTFAVQRVTIRIKCVTEKMTEFRVRFSHQITFSLEFWIWDCMPVFYFLHLCKIGN